MIDSSPAPPPARGNVDIGGPTRKPPRLDRAEPGLWVGPQRPPAWKAQPDDLWWNPDSGPRAVMRLDRYGTWQPAPQHTIHRLA